MLRDNWGRDVLPFDNYVITKIVTDDDGNEEVSEIYGTYIGEELAEILLTLKEQNGVDVFRIVKLSSIS